MTLSKASSSEDVPIHLASVRVQTVTLGMLSSYHQWVINSLRYSCPIAGCPIQALRVADTAVKPRTLVDIKESLAHVLCMTKELPHG